MSGTVSYLHSVHSSVLSVSDIVRLFRRHSHIFSVFKALQYIAQIIVFCVLSLYWLGTYSVAYVTLHVD